jgi:hypothetical protein
VKRSFGGFVPDHDLQIAQLIDCQNEQRMRKLQAHKYTQIVTKKSFQEAA